MIDSQSQLDLSNALLKWVQSFNASPPVKNLADLRDGHALYHILRDIDADYFVDLLPASSSETSNNWIPRWQNLKQVDRSVRAYVRDVCGVLDSSDDGTGEGNTQADLKAIAQNSEGHGDRDTVGLLRTILRAAMYSPESNQRMGRKVVALGPDVAKTIASSLAAMESPTEDRDEIEADETLDQPLEDHVTVDEVSDSRGREKTDGDFDAELQQEEKLIQAHRIIRQLEESNAKATAELEELRNDKASLQEAFESFRYETEASGKRRNEDDSVRELRTRADRDRDYIAELETELESSREAKSSHERQLERLKADSEAKQKLRDDLQVLKAERDELVNKSRANENLRKKIQTLQEQEKQNTSLREDLNVARDQLQSLDGLQARCEALQKANTENMNIIANTEQEIFDQKTSKKRLEHEYKVLQQKWELAKERQARDHETIKDLEGNLQSLDMNGKTTFDDQSGLEQELSSASGRRPLDSRKGSKDISIPSADLALVEDKLRAITARNAKLESDYLDMLQDKLGLETSLAELQDSRKEPEEKIPFLEQRKKLQAAQIDLAKLKDTIFATTTELAKTKETLLSSQDPAPRTNGEPETLDHQLEYQALSKSYAELSSHTEGIETDLAEHRHLLRHALLSHTAVLKEQADIRESNEFALVRKQLEAVQNAEHEDMIIDVATELTGKIETGRIEVLKIKEHLSTCRNDLTKTRQELEEQRNTPPPVISQQDSSGDANLERENRLVASAWYDLASRLQSNSVTVGRRREPPRSWLGKQRALVGLGIGSATGSHRP